MRARTHTCDVRSHVCGRTCACEIHSEKCAGCACVRLVFGRAMCDLTFAHFWNKIARKCYSRTSYPVLEHPVLLLNLLSCFRIPQKVENLLKNCWKHTENLLKKYWKNVTLPKVRVRVRSATTSNWTCAHVCVRTLNWTCEVRACDPKKGRNSHLGLVMGILSIG